MGEESQALDPYDLVLADLRAKRDKIDQTIQAILDFRGEGASAGVAGPPKQEKSVHPNDDVEGPGAFLGMTIVDAAKKLLAARRQPIGNVEFAAAFKAGGMGMTSTDPVNTVGSVLTRRSNQLGDVVKIGRGTWGLAEWYPGRNFKKKKAKDEAPYTGTGPGNAVVMGRPMNLSGKTDEDDEVDPWAPLQEGVFK